jgi:hypothetical protein
MAELKIVWPDGREQEFGISRTVTMIGRTKDNDLKISDKGISRKQCKIEGSPGNYSIVDLDSRNGTMVNGTKISTSQLRNGDLIRVGRVKLTFIEEEHADADIPAKSEGISSSGGPVCPSCGAVIKDGDVLCVKCGTFINKGSTFFPGGRSFSDSWMSWAVLAAVILLLAGVGLYLMGGGSGGTPETDMPLEQRVIETVRGIELPDGSMCGDRLDRMNISNDEIRWTWEDRGLDTYRVTAEFVYQGEDREAVFKVDLASGDGTLVEGDGVFNDF